MGSVLQKVKNFIVGVYEQFIFLLKKKGAFSGLYKYSRKDGNAYQYTEKLSQEQIAGNKLSKIIAELPKWKKIQCSQQQLQKIQALTKEMFERKVQRYVCPITLLVQRQPVKVKCCNNFFEKTAILTYINPKGKCPMCRAQLTRNQIITDPKSDELFERYDAIQMFRLQIRRTYLKLNEPLDKKEWEQKINMNMGVGYMKNSL